MKKLFTPRDQKPDGPDMLAAALEHLAAGRSVIPICSPAPGGNGCLMSGSKHGADCTGPGKTPLMPWKRLQTELPTEDEVRSWFRRWPRMNIGMATGAVSGTVVLDADSPSAVTDALEMGELESAPMVKTSKGAHWWLQHPGEEVRNFARKRPGLDFRGSGGYVVLPPSLHKSGVRYEWHATPEDMGGLAPVPSWLMELLKSKKPDREAGEATERGGIDFDTFVDGVGEGQRNDMLFRLACKLRGQALDLDLAKLAVVGAAERCNPPYDHEEALAIVDRVWETYDPNPPEPYFIDDEEDGTEVAAAESGGDNDPYPMISFAEFCSIEDEDEDWLIDGMVAAASCNWYYADPGVGKTLAALWYALHIAEGRPLQGRQTAQGPVVVFSEDTGSRRVRKYLNQLARGGGFDLTDMPAYINPIPTGLKLTDVKGCDIVRERARRYGARLVILDCCEKLVPSQDWKPAEYIAFNDMVTGLRESGVATIVIDHTNKEKGANGGKPKPGLNRVYGARAKTSNTDFAVEFNGSFKEGSVRATYTKQRDEPPADYEIKIIKAGDGFRLEIVADASLANLDDEERTIFKWLDRDPGKQFTAAEVADGIGVNKRSVQRYLRSLVTKGMVAAEEKRFQGGRTVLYCVPETPEELGVASNAA